MSNISLEKGFVYIPDGSCESVALSRVTDLCIAAHQDDIEIMAFPPIFECYESNSRHFCGVCATDGRGSPRCGDYASLSDEEMALVRIEEQKKASEVGKYSAQIMLGYSSKEIKSPENLMPVEDIVKILRATRPDTVYTHNLADKHDTHVATALRVISALNMLSDDEKPKKLILLEVWRSLDWVNDSEKKMLDASGGEALAINILSVYKSQIAGGKRYDLATEGRRLANATFFESHNVDEMAKACIGIDATSLLYGEAPHDFINNYIDSFRRDVNQRLSRYSSGV